MSFLKKLVLIKNYLGFLLIGLFFAIVGGLILFSENTEDILLPLIFLVLGIAVFGIFLYLCIKELKSPHETHKQYDRVDLSKAPQEEKENGFTSFDPEEEEDYVFHYFGKANQSHVMKDSNGNPVYEAVTDKILQIKPRPFLFHNIMTGEEETRMVSAAITQSAGLGDSFGSLTVSSTFKIDGKDIWDQIASMGYGFSFSLNGLAAHYEVRHWGNPVGYAELGGTGLINPKYKDNPLGKIPSKGIFKVHCKKKDVPGLFLICFAITNTEFTSE